MTLPDFGKVLPIHIAMLQLAGYVMDYDQRRVRAPLNDEERSASMREGLSRLRQWTGQDFGYDLSAWRQFLVQSGTHGYRHPNAFQTVDPAILEAAADRRRQQVVKELEEQDGSPPA